MLSAIGHLVSDGEHLVSSGAHDVGHAASSVAHTVVNDAKSVAHTVSKAANGLYQDGKKAFTKVENVASSGAKKIVGGAKDVSHLLGNTWHSVAHDASDAYNGLKGDAKQALVWGSGVANHLGVGSALNALGLGGGVNQKNVAINHHITSTYHNQSSELQKVLGPGSGANWATYASWASNRAGQAIQNHDDPGGSTAKDGNDLLCDLSPVDGPVGSKACQYVKDYQNESKQAAAGNQKVFHDIDPHLQNFIDTFKGVKQPNQQKWNQFAASFHGKEGDMLAGFHSYYNAMFQHGSQKAQSITAGNLQLGLHEQKLLQNNIAGAFPPGQGAAYTKGQTVRVGNQVQTLNDPVKAPKGQDSPYPPDLQNVTNPQLKQLLEQWGPSGGNLQNSGAQDWTSLPDRMKFITGLFMSSYNDPSLFQNPLNTNPMG